jgi:hypothetical protein
MSRARWFRLPSSPSPRSRKNSVENTAPFRNALGRVTGGNPGNSGGKKGRSGRRPDWIKTFCDDLLASPASKRQVKEILADKNHPAFATMWKAVCDRAHGKPDQTLQHSGTIVIREKREPRVLIADN